MKLAFKMKKFTFFQMDETRQKQGEGYAYFLKKKKKYFKQTKPLSY